MRSTDLSSHELDTLRIVQKGAFDGATCVTSTLDRLLLLGLVEISPITTLPVMPTRYRYTLSLLGEQILASDRADRG